MRWKNVADEPPKMGWHLIKDEEGCYSVPYYMAWVYGGVFYGDCDPDSGSIQPQPTRYLEITETDTCETCMFWEPDAMKAWGDCKSKKALYNVNAECDDWECDAYTILEFHSAFGCIYHESASKS